MSHLIYWIAMHSLQKYDPNHLLKFLFSNPCSVEETKNWDWLKLYIPNSVVSERVSQRVLQCHVYVIPLRYQPPSPKPLRSLTPGSLWQAYDSLQNFIFSYLPVWGMECRLICWWAKAIWDPLGTMLARVGGNGRWKEYGLPIKFKTDFC